MAENQGCTSKPVSEEREWLERINRAQNEPASHVVRAKEILAVVDGKTYTDAATAAGRKSGDAVFKLASEFNQSGLAAIRPRHGEACRYIWSC